jgi:hypothetical protein
VFFQECSKAALVRLLLLTLLKLLCKLLKIVRLLGVYWEHNRIDCRRDEGDKGECLVQFPMYEDIISIALQADDIEGVERVRPPTDRKTNQQSNHHSNSLQLETF